MQRDCRHQVRGNSSGRKEPQKLNSNRTKKSQNNFFEPRTGLRRIFVRSKYFALGCNFWVDELFKVRREMPGASFSFLGPCWCLPQDQIPTEQCPLKLVFLRSFKAEPKLRMIFKIIQRKSYDRDVAKRLRPRWHMDWRLPETCECLAWYISIYQ